MERLLKKLNRMQVLLAGIFLVLMITLTCANIFLRQVGYPLRGTFELMGFMGALIFALSLGYAHEKKEHLYVSILFDRLPPVVQKAAFLVNRVVCIAFFFLLAFQLVKTALNLRNVGEVSETLRIPYYPLLLVLSFCTGFLGLLFVYELIKGDDSFPSS